MLMILLERIDPTLKDNAFIASVRLSIVDVTSFFVHKTAKILDVAFAERFPMSPAGMVIMPPGQAQKREQDAQLTRCCLCGAVTYQTDCPPLRASHCHCKQCHRSSGSVALTLAVFNADQVTFPGSTMKDVRPTNFSTLSFYPECGSRITFRFDDRLEMVAVTVGTLDQPEKALIIPGA